MYVYIYIYIYVHIHILRTGIFIKMVPANIVTEFGNDNFFAIITFSSVFAWACFCMKNRPQRLLDLFEEIKQIFVKLIEGNLYTNIYTYICICIYMYIYIYICICIYTLFLSILPAHFVYIVILSLSPISIIFYPLLPLFLHPLSPPRCHQM
jgi:Na+/H+-dicarboxylate symporter